METLKMFCHTLKVRRQNHSAQKKYLLLLLLLEDVFKEIIFQKMEANGVVGKRFYKRI